MNTGSYTDSDSKQSPVREPPSLGVVKAIGNTSQDSYVLIDSSFKIVWVNSALENKGFLLGNIKGHDFFRVFENLDTPPHDHPTCLAAKTNAVQQAVKRGADGKTYAITSIPLVGEENQPLILEISREAGAAPPFIREAEMGGAEKAGSSSMPPMPMDELPGGDAGNTPLPLHKISDYTFDTVLIADSNYNTLYVNKRFEELTGHTKKEMIGHIPTIFKRPREKIGPDKEFWKTILHGKVWAQKSERVHLNGTLFYTETKVVPLQDSLGKNCHYLLLERDITRLKELKDELEKYKLFPHSNPDPIVQVDYSGNILFANDIAKQSFFKVKAFSSLHELLGRDASLLIARIKETGRAERLQHYSS